MPQQWKQNLIELFQVTVTFNHTHNFCKFEIPSPLSLCVFLCKKWIPSSQELGTDHKVHTANTWGVRLIVPKLYFRKKQSGVSVCVILVYFLITFLSVLYLLYLGLFTCYSMGASRL
jgi:hypothetical protein